MTRKKIVTAIFVLLIIAVIPLPIVFMSGCSNDSPTPMVAAGFAHTVVLRQDGTVWTWGRNEEGQLGNGGRQNSFSPVRFRIDEWTHQGITYRPPPRIVKVASHKIHTLALGCDGSVWAGGWNEEGQLGANVGCRLTPIRVPFPDANTRITDIDAGMLFSIALRDNGYVYGWGRNRHDLMGFGTNMEQLSRAQRIEGLELHSIRQISAGHEHVLALRQDGAVVAWGRNRNGQVGDFRYPQDHPTAQLRGRLTSDVGIPTVIAFPGNPRIVEVAAGGFHSLARCENGFVYAWGRSDRGQIGDNLSYLERYADGTPRLHPVGHPQAGQTIIRSAQPIPQRVNIQNVVSITGSSGDSNVAILADGTLRSWGRNQEGQLGDGTLIDRAEPVQVLRGHGVPLRNITSIAVGETHMSAICGATGDVISWGSNWCGEVGNGNVLTSMRPVQVRSGIRCEVSAHIPAPIVDSEPLTGITRLAAGHLFTLALGSDNIAHGWGRNNHGQLLMQHSIDHRVATPLKDFRVSDPRFLGIRSSWIYHMGQNPVDSNFATLDGVTDIAAGMEAGHAFGLAVRNGYAYGWGDNMEGWLGHGNIPHRRRTLGDEPKDNNPRRMRNAAGEYISAYAVAAGGRHSLILRSRYGQVYAAGRGSDGRLGHGMRLSGGGNDVSFQYFPVRVPFPGGTAITDIEAGMLNSFAIDSAGYLWAWGRNNTGQLGTGDTESRHTPVRVLGPQIRAGGERVVAVSAATYHTLALTDGGRVFSWGVGWHGRLGHGNAYNQQLPTHINIAAFNEVGVMAVSAGGSHSVAVRNDGTVWTWGNNTRYQLGRTSTWNEQLTPRQVSHISNARQVVSGNEHSVAISGQGAGSTVWSWGSNNAGALGNGGSQTYRPRDDGNPGAGDEIIITPHRELFAARATGVHANFTFFNALRADFPPATASGSGVNVGIIILIIFIILLIILLITPFVYVAISKKTLTVGMLTFHPLKRAAKKQGRTKSNKGTNTTLKNSSDTKTKSGESKSQTGKKPK